MVAKFRAMQEGCSGVVFATDADSIESPARAAKVAAIEEGFASMPGEIGTAPCVPMGTAEAWLLSDAEAWRTLGAKDLTKLPTQPERAWGRPHDPKSGHPKSVFQAICKENSIPDDQRSRADLAEALSINTAISRCRTSFGPFVQAMRAL